MAEIKVPTLILHGKTDRFAPYALAQEMHDRIPGSEMVTFDGGHLFFFGKKKEVAEEVKEFLQGRRASRHREASGQH